ncbi:hypothetical protein F9278_27860 [Streptomyces phaeolivaceus]|uniref:Type II toxin-antitoxin system RelE/ParE family toxin n=1 Tax=Streptomyces phaeolivaceus TaxID=2653200 RepID=A0A5P8K936_9ACTN|nr:hypothetical protein [Streptomyces phaeolivaceus]QFQ99332.1 hypothetical protein F9278_27860 [Streptomyces phaeolivaceus]
MSRARFGFAAHPEALADLREVPDHIRDLALLELQHLVHGNERGAPLVGRLAGCHKVYIDPKAEWRLVIQFRDAPAGSRHNREIYLIAAGEREAGAVYRAAAQRLNRSAETTPEAAPLRRQAEAARARSPHLRSVPATSTSASLSDAPRPRTTAESPAVRKAHA